MTTRVSQRAPQAHDRADDGLAQETIWGMLEGMASLEPGRPFVRSDQEPVLSRSEVLVRATAVADALAGAGVAPGDRVATMTANCVDAVLLWFAIARLGAVEVPLNLAMREDRIAHVLRTAGVSLCVADDDHVEVLARTVEAHGLASVRAIETHASFRSGSAVSPDPAPPATLTASDPACILFTSGTTGPAKGAVLSQGYFTQHGKWRSSDFGLDADDVSYTCLPLSHVNAKIVTLMASLAAGGQAVFDSSFSARRFWDRLEEVGATMFTFIGNMAAALLAQEPREVDSRHRGRLCYGAPVPAGRFDEFEARFNTRITAGFGMTEASSVMYNPPESGRLGALGIETGVYHVMLEGEDGRWSTGTEPARGELCLRPRVPNVLMSGYHGDPEATVRAWRDLWFHTGDLVERDPDGYYWLAGRLKDTIRRRGENIAASDVESVTVAVDGVAECAAIAVPSETGEEEIKLVVVLEPKAELSHAAVLRDVASKLPKFAVPLYVEFVPELPKTITGRVEKYKLVQEWASPTTYDATTDAFVGAPQP